MSSTNLAEHLEYYLGIDVSKQVLDCWLRPQGEWMQCSNTPAGFAELTEWLRACGAAPEHTIICMGEYRDLRRPAAGGPDGGRVAV